jgi:Tfp pilus assembly protein PilF
MTEFNVGRQLAMATRFLEVGNLDGAIDMLRQALTFDPDEPDAHALLALCLVERRRIHAARHEAEIAVTLDPESPLSHRAMATVLIATRRFAEAGPHVQAVIDHDPNDPDAYLLRAQLLSLQGDEHAMLRDLEKALELDPENVDARVRLGHHHLERGRIGDAFAESRAALEIDPESHAALLLRGWVALRRGDPAEARDHAIWVLRDDPSDRAALQLLAAVKADTSRLLGLWWKWNTWMGSLGDGRAIVVLLVAFVVYRVATIFVAYDLDQPVAAQVINLAWLGLVAYTWLGPAIFFRRLKEELRTVRLRDF